jgi:hypothetical protein
MSCEEIKKVLLEAESIEEIISNQIKIREHIERCSVCKLFIDKLKIADNNLSKLKQSRPELEEPELLTNRIMYKIRTELVAKEQNHKSVYDRISHWLILKQVRLALYSAILFFTVIYFYEEAAALNSLVKLETQLSETGQNYEASITDNLPNLSFLYDLYKLIKGDQKYLSLSKEWLVVNKGLLKQLLLEYDSLTPEKIKAFEKLRKNLTKEQNELLDEIMSLNKNEIEVQKEMIK